jgi:hypothetical protein
MSTSQPSERIAAQEVPADRIPASVTLAGWTSGPLLAVCTTLVAGVLAWALVQWLDPLFTNEEDADAFGNLPPAIQWQLDRNNVMFVLAVIGGLACAGLVAAEAISRRSLRTALGAGIPCIAIAAAVGGLAGYVGLLLFQHYKANLVLSDLNKTIRVYAVMLGILGSGVGLSVGICLGRRIGSVVNCLIGGLLAGILAAILYPVIVAMLLPGAVTKVLVPLLATERFVWFALIAATLGVIIPSVAGKRTAAR